MQFQPYTYIQTKKGKKRRGWSKFLELVPDSFVLLYYNKICSNQIKQKTEIFFKRDNSVKKSSVHDQIRP
jgi:hypothetical protein